MSPFLRFISCDSWPSTQGGQYIPRAHERVKHSAYAGSVKDAAERPSASRDLAASRNATEATAARRPRHGCSGVTTINGELAETAENIFALRVQRVLFRTLGHAVRRTENTISCVRVYPVGKEPAMVALVLQHPNGAALLSVDGAHQAARFR